MRAGQFWVFLGFSLAIMATTMLDQTPTQSTALNAACVGFALLACAIVELSGLQLWMDRLQIALGVWLAVSPFMLPDAALDAAMWAHVLLGSGLAVIGGYYWGRDRAAARRED